MKKLFILVLTLGLSMLAEAQPKEYYVYHVVLIDKQTDKIISSTEVNYKMLIKNSVISFTNQGMTTYLTDKDSYGWFTDEDRSYGRWMAKDDENIACTVTMSFYHKGINSLSVSYSDVFITYYFKLTPKTAPKL